MEKSSKMSQVNSGKLKNFQAILKKNPNPSATKIHMIGLEEIKTRLGKRWAKHKGRVLGAAKSILQHHLSTHDLCLPYGELGFVVLFAEADQHSAAITCGLVKAELLRRFVGDEALDGLDIHTETMSLDLDSIEAVSLAKTLRKIASETSDDGEEIDSSLNLEQENSHSFQPIENEIQDLYPAASEADINRIERAIVTSALERNEVNEALGHSANLLRFRFDPIYQPKSGVIGTFTCVPTRTTLTGRELESYRVLTNDNEASVLLLDRLILAHCMETLIDSVKERRLGLIIVPVSFDTFARPASRQEYLQQLMRLPQDLRRFVVPFIRRLPKGVPESRLVDIASALKPNVRAIGARVHMDVALVQRLRSCGFYGASLVLHPYGENGRIHPDLIEKGAEMLIKAGMSPTLSGIASKKHRDRAVDAGFHFLCGPAIASRVEQPFEPRSWDLTGGAADASAMFEPRAVSDLTES